MTSRASPLRVFLVHLRVPFQLALAPFFLLGSWAAREQSDGAAGVYAWLAVFAAVHVGLYGGATVYNSYYDRDVGPVGMLKRPPPVTRGLLHASIAVQALAVAAVGALAASPRAAVLALAMAVLSVGYSHPRWRWKGRTWGGLAVVGLGQGVLAVLLGHQAAVAAAPDARTWACAVAAAVIAVGLYPLTQIYQIDEDAGRGDVTLPVRFGWRAAMLFSGLTASVGLALLAACWRAALPEAWPWALAAAVLALAVYVAAWWRRFESQDAGRNHDWAMAMSVAVSFPLGAALALRLASAWS